MYTLICIRIYVGENVYIYISICIHMCVNVDISLYVHICVDVSLYVDVCVYISLYFHMNTCVCTCMCTHVYEHMYPLHSGSHDSFFCTKYECRKTSHGLSCRKTKLVLVDILRNFVDITGCKWINPIKFIP